MFSNIFVFHTGQHFNQSKLVISGRCSISSKKDTFIININQHKKKSKISIFVCKMLLNVLFNHHVYKENITFCQNTQQKHITSIQKKYSEDD